VSTVTHKARHLVWAGKFQPQKTALTECGKRVAVSKLSGADDATCPECRAAVDRDAAAAAALITYGEGRGLDTAPIAAAFAQAAPARYRTQRVDLETLLEETACAGDPFAHPSRGRA
jgi:hypothetical protein